MYAQTGRPTDLDSVQWDEEDMNGYQLLNEVGSGGTLSSLFTILSLFTEDVKISWPHAVVDADRMHGARAPEGLGANLSRRNTRSRGDSDVSEFGLEGRRNNPIRPRKSRDLSPSASSSGSTVLVPGASTVISRSIKPYQNIAAGICVASVDT